MVAVMSKESEEIDLDDPRWEIDADITRKELRQFQKVGENAVAHNDDSIINPWFARLVKAWPYESDPANPDSYENLKLSQFKEVAERVQAAFQKIAGT